MFDRDMCVETFDKALWAVVEAEVQRQEDHIELIASENYVSPCVMEMLRARFLPINMLKVIPVNAITADVNMWMLQSSWRLIV